MDISIKISKHKYGRTVSSSGLAFKKFINVGGPLILIIKGEVDVLLFSHSPKLLIVLLKLFSRK